MSDDLNAFLNGGKPEEEPQPEPQVEEPVAETPPEPEAPAEPAPAEMPAEPAAPANGRMVPLAALEAERTKRQEFERQLEQYRKQQQPQSVAQQPWVNPAEQPAEYHERVQQLFLNERLNTSEMLLRREMGSEKVDAVVAEFKQAAEADPTLMQKLYAQQDPYKWLAQETEALRLRKEIGEDPAAYRARIRAEIEAEMAGNAVAPQVPTQVTPSIPTMAPSLAKARSAAPRSAPAFTGTPHVNDVFGNRD